MKIWFMYDNHTFCRVGDGTTSREVMEERARQAFAEDGCGSLFAKDAHGQQITVCHGTIQASGRYGMSDAALAKLFDRVDEHVNLAARG